MESGADRAESDLLRKTTCTRMKEDFRKVLRVCEIKTTNRNKELNFLAKSQPLGPALNALDPAAQRWRRMSMAVNSGACKTVVNPDELSNYEVFEMPSSRARAGFTGASGDAIPNLGGMQVQIMTREGAQRLLAVTAAPVRKSLLAVDQLNASGHVVVFDQDTVSFQQVLQ